MRITLAMMLNALLQKLHCLAKADFPEICRKFAVHPGAILKEPGHLSEVVLGMMRIAS